MTATRLHALGWRMVPWTPRRSRTDSSKPLMMDWQHSTADPAVWHKLYPDCDWSVVVPDGVVCIDLENKHGVNGRAVLEALGFSPLRWTHTKSGGLHSWYRTPAQLSAGYVLPGVEVKPPGSSVHVPPSFGYMELRPLPAPADLPPMPAWLLDICLRPANTSTSAAEIPVRFSAGERRKQLCRIAGIARERMRCNEYEIQAILTLMRETRCDSPEDIADDDIRRIAVDYARKKITTQDKSVTAWLAKYRSDV